jgi:hypothetical protein
MAEQLTAIDAARQALTEAATLAVDIPWPIARKVDTLLETASVNAQIAAAEAQIASANALTAGLDLLLEIRQALEHLDRSIDRPVD